MIRNISYNDTEITREIVNHVGDSFSFKKRIKLGGIGSPRYTIINASKNIQKILEPNHSLAFANIELRPRGIIIGFRSLLDTWGWIISFNQLAIFQDQQGYFIQSGSTFIHLQNTLQESANNSFFKKLLSVREQYISKLLVQN